MEQNELIEEQFEFEEDENLDVFTEFQVDTHKEEAEFERNQIKEEELRKEINQN